MADNNLYQILAKEGLSQSQLANVSGLSSGTVNRIATKKKSGAPRTNHKIVKGINVLCGKDYDYKDVFPQAKEY